MHGGLQPDGHLINEPDVNQTPNVEYGTTSEEEFVGRIESSVPPMFLPVLNVEIFALEDISKGQELLLCYGSEMPRNGYQSSCDRLE